MISWDNHRFCNKLVVVLSKWNEWSFGVNSLKNDNMIINNWIESEKENQQQTWLYFCVCVWKAQVVH